MDKITALRARDLLKVLTELEIIKEDMQRNRGQIWRFFVSNTILSSDLELFGRVLPDVLREEFEAAVNRSIERINKEIKKL